MKTVGNQMLLDRMRLLLSRVNAPSFKVQRNMILKQLGITLFAYFNQRFDSVLYDNLTWHKKLAMQLTEVCQVDIRPGSIDSKGWLSAIIEFESYSLTFLLFDEAFTEDGIHLLPVEKPTGHG